jgi:hypothetical protein
MVKHKKNQYCQQKEKWVLPKTVLTTPSASSCLSMALAEYVSKCLNIEQIL